MHVVSTPDGPLVELLVVNVLSVSFLSGVSSDCTGFSILPSARHIQVLRSPTLPKIFTSYTRQSLQLSPNSYLFKDNRTDFTITTGITLVTIDPKKVHKSFSMTGTIHSKYLVSYFISFEELYQKFRVYFIFSNQPVSVRVLGSIIIPVYLRTVVIVIDYGRTSGSRSVTRIIELN